MRIRCFVPEGVLSSVLSSYYYGNLSYPSQDPSRVGFLSTVPADAGDKLRAAVTAASNNGGNFVCECNLTSWHNPSTSFYPRPHFHPDLCLINSDTGSCAHRDANIPDDQFKWPSSNESNANCFRGRFQGQCEWRFSLRSTAV